MIILPSLDVDNHLYDDDTQERPNVVQYVVKVWPHCLLGFIKIRPACPRASWSNLKTSGTVFKEVKS